MSRRQQHQRALFEKRKAQESLKKTLTPWVAEITATYRPGNTVVSFESKEMLKNILTAFYNRTTKSVLRFDIREFKQDEEELDRLIRIDLSTRLNTFFTARALNMSERISQTASAHVERTTRIAVEETMAQIEAKRTLRNFLNNQKLVIATTEAQTTVETTRGTTIRVIQDPLRNTMEQMLQFIEAGDYNAAGRLSRQVRRLLKLPISESQGRVINFVNDNRADLLDPRFQGQSLARIRRAAGELDKKQKKWQSIGDSKVRESHSIANAQSPIDIDQPFILPGGALQWPGDASLGASLSEVINCRCTAIYV